TALDSDRDRIRGYEAGVDDYIAKPFADEELCARVRRVYLRVRSEGDRDDYAGLTGDLRQVSVASLLAFAEGERRSGMLTLRGAGSSAARSAPSLCPAPPRRARCSSAWCRCSTGRRAASI